MISLVVALYIIQTVHVSMGVRDVLVSSALLPQELQEQLGSYFCCAVLGRVFKVSHGPQQEMNL